VQLAHTADLDAATLAAVRSLLEHAFGDEFGKQDWEHCLGGMHVLLWEGDELIGQRRGSGELGALSATNDGVGFYTALGWRLWEGPTHALSPAGVVRTEEDDGSVFVLPVSVELDLAADLTCDWRDGEVW
jgi:aminoglycoside 2'-N-acetyltransferase I